MYLCMWHPDSVRIQYRSILKSLKWSSLDCCMTESVRNQYRHEKWRSCTALDSNPRARGARSCVLTIEPTRRRTSSRTLIQQYIYTCILGTVYSICNARQLLYPLVWQNHIQNLYDENTCKNAPGWQNATHTILHSNLPRTQSITHGARRTQKELWVAT